MHHATIFPSDRSLVDRSYTATGAVQLNDKIRSRAGGVVLGSAMMAIKGYFRRAPTTTLQGRNKKRKQQQAAEQGNRGGGGGGDDSLGAALLDDELPAAAAVPPRGYFAVYVGAEARRFVVPTDYLRQPAFRDLMERAAEEFGFAQAAGIRIPCREDDFEATLAALELELASAVPRRRTRSGTGTGRATALPRAMSCSKTQADMHACRICRPWR